MEEFAVGVVVTVRVDALTASRFVARSLSSQDQDLSESAAKALREMKELFTKLLDEKIPYDEVRHALSLAYLDYKIQHPKVKVFVIVKRPHPRVVDGELSHKELVTMQKSIDIPFEELSARAKKLYLDTVEEIKKPKPQKLKDFNRDSNRA